MITAKQLKKGLIESGMKGLAINFSNIATMNVILKSKELKMSLATAIMHDLKNSDELTQIDVYSKYLTDLKSSQAEIDREFVKVVMQEYNKIN